MFAMVDRRWCGPVFAAEMVEYVESGCLRPQEVTEGHHREPRHKRSISGAGWTNKHCSSLLAIHARLLEVVHSSWQHMGLRIDESIKVRC